MKNFLISAISALTIGAAGLIAAPALAAEGGHVENIDFSFEGPFGTYDQQQLRRGFQVYREVCSACHGLKYVAYRSLADNDGLGMDPAWVRAFAAEHDVIDKETGEERPAKETDHFATVTGEGMGPDLSLMAKGRAGFHGPYGLGINQFFKGMGGPEYISSILTGYDGEEKEEAGSYFYGNHTFAGGWIAMPPPLSDELIEYEDGTPATVHQMAQDVSAFLMWTAEPKLMPRKRWGFVAVLLLVVLSTLLYLTNKKLWAPHKGKHVDL
ncbi:cytochrome c1 [Thioclava sp.]|uniref:cytochrome c1 n=1 Tax=Thioclava sp. TaxID=1933450 RepID=UPI003AA8E201